MDEKGHSSPLYMSLTVALAWIYSEEFVKSQCPDAFIVKNTRVPACLQFTISKSGSDEIQICYFFICTVVMIFISVNSSRPPKVNDLDLLCWKAQYCFYFFYDSNNLCSDGDLRSFVFCVTFGNRNEYFSCSCSPLVRYFPQVSDIVALFKWIDQLRTTLALKSSSKPIYGESSTTIWDSYSGAMPRLSGAIMVHVYAVHVEGRYCFESNIWCSVIMKVCMSP